MLCEIFLKVGIEMSYIAIGAKWSKLPNPPSEWKVVGCEG